MPAKDKTGPEGKGPLTGRGFGNCNPSSKDVDNTNIYGYRRGLGFRQGRSRRYAGYGFRHQNTNEE